MGGQGRRGGCAGVLGNGVRGIGEKVALLDEPTLAREEQQNDLLLQIPNLPHVAAPIGKDPSENPVVRSWGEKPQINGTVLDHVALGTRLNDG